MFGLAQKNWYKISDEVMYSTNFRFFLENQVTIEEDKDEVRVISNVDKHVLGVINLKPDTTTFNDFNLKEKLEELHDNLLEGKIYPQKGVRIN